MRRVAVAAAVLAGTAMAVGAVDAIGDATQTRPDRLRRGHRTEVVFRITTRDARADQDLAAQSLWGACRHTAVRRVVGDGLARLADGSFRIVLEPELGMHARQRLTGCLHDLTLDRVRGRVVSIRSFAP